MLLEFQKIDLNDFLNISLADEFKLNHGSKINNGDILYCNLE